MISKIVSIIISIIIPMIMFQICKIFAVGIPRMNSVQAMNSALKMIGFGNAQTGIITMMILSLVIYIASTFIFDEIR